MNHKIHRDIWSSVVWIGSILLGIQTESFWVGFAALFFGAYILRRIYGRLTD